MLNKIYQVARHEYVSNVTRRSFLFTVFGLPAFVVVIMFIVVLITSQESITMEELGQIGYVDRADITTTDAQTDPIFVAYENEDAAMSALEADDIGAYIVLPEDYFQSGEVAAYYEENIPDDFDNAVADFIQAHLIASVDTPEQNNAAARLQDAVNQTIILEDSGRVVESTEGLLGLFLVPMIFAFVFVMSMQITSGFLMQGVVQEKSNRIMEILVTSIRPLELLAGKLIGIGLLGLTQIVVWLVAGAVTLLFAGDSALLASVTVPLDLVLIALLYFILTYFLMASIMAGIGVVVEGEQESRGYAGILGLAIWIPVFFVVTFLEDANGTLPVAFSIVPITSAVSMLLRISFGTVTPAEFALSIGALVLTTAFFTWASAKVFRWGVLLYGQNINLRSLWRVLRGPAEPGVVVQEPATKQS